MHLWSHHKSIYELKEALAPTVAELGLEISLSDLARKPRVLIAVSKFDHCLNDLLHKWRIGSLPIDIVGIVSNRLNLKPIARWHGVNFTHLPISKDTKP